MNAFVKAVSIVFLCALLPTWAFAQTEVVTEDAPAFQIVFSGIVPPTTCDQHGWRIDYKNRTTTMPDESPYDLTRYYVQYVNGDLNLVSYAWNGYSAYADTYAVSKGGDSYSWRGITTTYDIPLWADTYQAENVEYILHSDQIIWEIRTELDCAAGAVTDYSVTSQAATGVRTDLPADYQNLVVALEDIPRYRLEYTKQDLLGTIHACQTFYITDIVHRRASLEVDVTDSLTHHAMIINNGSLLVPQIVDVADNYGQLDGQPILDQCKGK